MQTGKDRSERQNEQRPAGLIARRLDAGLRLFAPLAVLAITATALSAAPAQAATGGASSIAPGGAEVAAENLAFTPMRSAGATWYGPGLYGRHTACGEDLRPDTIGVANKTLPCGTTVKFAYHGHTLITQVIDRGPYTRGNSWDLTNGARLALGFNGAGQVQYAVALSYARH
jgi:rare lipoprotein A (peptidoglycan hydrolase)